jgi:hypothetical protein
MGIPGREQDARRGRPARHWVNGAGRASAGPADGNRLTDAVFSGNVPRSRTSSVYTRTPGGMGPDVPGRSPELSTGHGGLPDRGGRPARQPGTTWAGPRRCVALLSGLVRRLILISASIGRGSAGVGPLARPADLVRFLGPGYQGSPRRASTFPVVASKVVTMLAGAPALALRNSAHQRPYAAMAAEMRFPWTTPWCCTTGFRIFQLAIIRNLTLPAAREACPVQRDHAGLPDRRSRSRRPPGAARPRRAGQATLMPAAMAGPPAD